MMTDQSSPPGHDRDYLSRREAQERDAASRAPDPAASRVHAALAEQYAALLRRSGATAG